MNYEEWVEKYKPIKNSQGSFDWSPFDEDFNTLSESDPHFIWTNTACDGWDVLQAGWHRVNSMDYYYLTEVAWEDGFMDEVVIHTPDDKDFACDKCGGDMSWNDMDKCNKFDFDEMLCKKCFSEKLIELGIREEEE